MKPDSWFSRNFPVLSMGWVYDFVLWLGKAAIDKVTDKPSSRKIVALMSATAMSIGILALMLTKAYWVYMHGGDIYWELGAVTAPLCVLAGFNYKAGMEEREKPKPPEKPPGANE